MADLGLVVQVLVPGLLAKGLFALCVSGVVAGKERGASVLNLDDPVYDFIEELPVMRYDQHGSAVIQEIVLKPGNAGDV